MLEQTSIWPDLPFMRVVLVRLAQRPVDKILKRAWELWEFDKDDFLKTVYAVWCDPPTNIFTWTFGEMLNRIDTTGYRPDATKWRNVQFQIPEWKKIPPPTIGPLIGYDEGSGRINLEDGHTRLTAAHLAKAFPTSIRVSLRLSCALGATFL